MLLPFNTYPPIPPSEGRRDLHLSAFKKTNLYKKTGLRRQVKTEKLTSFITIVVIINFLNINDERTYSGKFQEIFSKQQFTLTKYIYFISFDSVFIYYYYYFY